MGVTIEGSGPLILPRKKLPKSRSKSRAKQFDPHHALADLIEAARIDIGKHVAVDIANGDGIVVELPVAHETTKQLVKKIQAASKRIDAVIHVVQPWEKRPRVLVAVLPPDANLSAPGVRFMLREEMVNAVDATRGKAVDERAWRALEAYDVLRGRVGDALALASALDEVVDAIPAVADRDQSRRLARLIYFAGELHTLLDEIVTEGETTAAALIKSPSSTRQPQSAYGELVRPKTEILSATREQRARLARAANRGPSPRPEGGDGDLASERIREIEADARRRLRTAKQTRSPRSVSRPTDRRRSRR